MLAKGQLSTVILEILYCLGVFLMISRARKGMKVPPIVKVAGLDALDEAIGRATEMGKPVFYSPGIGTVSESPSLASYSCLSHVAKQCAQYDTRIIVPTRTVQMQPITEEIVHQAFVEVGKADAYNSNDVFFLSSEQFAYASGCVGIMNRERPAAAIHIGTFFAESLIFAEVGSQIGAIQIAGTTSTAQLPFFVAACDYTLIGDEIYAASAYLSKDPSLVGNLIAQDYGKMLGMGMILIGTLLATFSPKGSTTKWLNDFLMVK